MNNENIIDQIGSLMAQVGPLENEIKRLSALLKDQGAGKHVGAHFGGTVVLAESVEDDAALKADLKAAAAAYRATLSHQYITAHTAAKITPRLLVKRLLNDAAAA